MSTQKIPTIIKNKQDKKLYEYKLEVMKWYKELLNNEGEEIV